MKLLDKILHLRIFLCFVIPVFVLVPIPLKYSSIIAQTEEGCNEQLTKADEAYKIGNWPEAIDLINRCLLAPEIDEVEQGRAYRLLGLVYIAMELEKEANDAVKNLLIMVPNYEIDPDIDPPQLKRIMDDISQTLEPGIDIITPNSADAEADGFTMTVDGIDFVYGSVVQFNGEDRATNFISSTQLTAKIPPSDLKKEGEYEVTVNSPIMSGKTSNAVKFKVKSSGGAPWTWIGIGAGVVAAGVVAVLVLGGEEETIETETIAEPPVRP